MKPTIYTMKVAEVKDDERSRIRLPAQTTVEFLLDDLFSIGELDRSGYNDGANIVLRFNNVANPTLTVHFVDYRVGQASRDKLVADWKTLLEEKHAPLPPPFQPPVPNTIGMPPFDTNQMERGPGDIKNQPPRFNDTGIQD